MDFLDDPTTRPNDDCVEEVAEPNFVIINREITLIPFSYDFAGFGGVRPAEWLELFPGFWMRSLDDSVSLTQGVGYGSIDLDSYFSYFEVSQEEAERAYYDRLDGLQKGDSEPVLFVLSGLFAWLLVSAIGYPD